MKQQNTILLERKEIWKSKKLLKRLYHHWYAIIGGELKPGSILEIGGGSGNLKDFFPQAISSDIIFIPWADAVLDAHHLPFKNAALDNIVLFDVLHHLMDPFQFLVEVQRVLKKNGRIIFMEPYVSWVSFIVYRFFHHEGMQWKIDFSNGNGTGKKKNHFHGNQAIPTLIFEREKQFLAKKIPRLRIIRKEKMDCLIYPLSGGFHYASLFPMIMYNVFRFLERLLAPLNQFLAFRLFVVMEKV